VAQQLGIDHLVFNFSDDFNEHVVAPYVQAHVDGITPNPCIECNRHLKFDRLSERARVLGFDAVATGHHAQVSRGEDGVYRLTRGHDELKDQSYVVYMLDQTELAYTMFPVGHMTKAQVRDRAVALGLRTATKPDSQDVCFISRTGGRETFLGNRIEFRKAAVVTSDGVAAGAVDALELVTIGQRRGLGLPGGGPKQFVVDVDTPNARVVIGSEDQLLRSGLAVINVMWANVAPVVGQKVLVQSSAHGTAVAATVERVDVVSIVASVVESPVKAKSSGSLVLRFDVAQRRIAPGQSIVCYDETNSFVLGGGIAEAINPVNN
jgi:tRNA-specific 2-thiouridylase